VPHQSYFNRLFFPATIALVSLLLAYCRSHCHFSFGSRGVIFSHIGDRGWAKENAGLDSLTHGRRTALIGFLPTYAAIGVAAPVLLCYCVCFRGLVLW